MTYRPAGPNPTTMVAITVFELVSMIRDLGADEIVRDGKSLADAGGADVILGTARLRRLVVACGQEPA